MHWTTRYLRWISALSSFPEDAAAVQTYRQAMEFREKQMALIMTELSPLAEHASCCETVSRLCCFKDIEYLTALALALEIGSFRRFPTAQGFMDYLGLVPSAHSTGTTRREGPIPGAGNGRLRHLLIQAAWHYVRPPASAKISSNAGRASRWR